ncbi:hypothetical protein BH23ACT2_BH23ACT2_02900 [soil metagenome]
MNLYEALDLSVGAGDAEIRRAYLGAARRHHPDFHVAADERTRAAHARRMQLANEAWAVLGDPVSRERYDLSLRQPARPANVRERPRREPTVPAGKGWTPRPGDDGWQQDFAAWADDDDVLAADTPGAPRPRGPLAVLPVAVFALAVLSGFLGLAMGSRPLMAGAFIGVAISAALFVMIPIATMARGRHRD